MWNKCASWGLKLFPAKREIRHCEHVVYILKCRSPFNLHYMQVYAFFGDTWSFGSINLIYIKIIDFAHYLFHFIIRQFLISSVIFKFTFPIIFGPCCDFNLHLIVPVIFSYRIIIYVGVFTWFVLWLQVHTIFNHYLKHWGILLRRFHWASHTTAGLRTSAAHCLPNSVNKNQTCHCLNRNRFIGQNIILKYFSQAGRPLNKTNSCIYSHATDIRSLFSRTSWNTANTHICVPNW